MARRFGLSLPQPVIVLLSRRVPQTQPDASTLDQDVCGVVVEHCGHVLGGEAVGAVAHQQGGLADRAVADDLRKLGHVRLGWVRFGVL